MNRIDFDAIPWSSTLPHMRERISVQNGKRLRLLELGKDFVEPDWCTKGHMGYVVSGEMELTFADHAETLREGDGFVIPPGEPGKHMPKALTDTVRMFLVEDA